eukprot:TRINITY_DN2837_c0_g1_i1.p1 TRINITY_DN2837_c0_g1~~TRINITY_DN2837_c0_g1_i1.p1  ORF type:complete len:387 (+),score=78.50 TRINITY_DN2837_c0_g1_i1:78-1163(+)
MAVLLDAFYEFASETGMDGRSFVKCLRNSALIDGTFSTAEADLVFTKHKAKGARKIDFDTFVRALEEVAIRRGMTQQQVQDVLCLCSGHGAFEQPLPEQESVEATGPERFFYDTSLYTGTHKHGGPSVSGSGSREVPAVDFKELVNRDSNEAAGQQRIKSARARNNADQGPVLLGRERRPVFALKGPERFFYDKSTYTGTHRNGGPDMHGSGIPKEGYGDLKELVCRDHTQDDDLNRRRRAEAALADIAEVKLSPRQTRNSPMQMRNSPRKMPNDATQMQNSLRHISHSAPLQTQTRNSPRTMPSDPTQVQNSLREISHSAPLPVLLGSASQHRHGSRVDMAAGKQHKWDQPVQADEQQAS